jgi:hypothetical protein
MLHCGDLHLQRIHSHIGIGQLNESEKKSNKPVLNSFEKSEKAKNTRVGAIGFTVPEVENGSTRGGGVKTADEREKRACET